MQHKLRAPHGHSFVGVRVAELLAAVLAEWWWPRRRRRAAIAAVPVP